MGKPNKKNKITVQPNYRTNVFKFSNKNLSLALASREAALKRIQKNTTRFKSNKKKIAKKTVLDEIPVIQADEERLKSTLKAYEYIQELEEKYKSEYGAVKLKFNTNFFQLNSDTITNIINDKKTIGVNLYSYKLISEGTYIHQPCEIDEINLLNLKKSYTEKTFWENVDKIKTIHYGDIEEKINEKFSILSCVKLFENLFPNKKGEMILESKYGCQGSTFGFHIDPYSLVGLNLIKTGGEKLWYFAPKHNYEKIKKMLDNLPVAENEVVCARQHFTTIFHPSKMRGICHSTIQKKGELIVLFSNVYHSGINLRPNIALTGTLSTKNWLSQEQYPECTCDFQLTKEMVRKMQNS